MRQPGHKSARVKLVHLLFKKADAHHLAIHPQQFLFADGSCHFGIPDMRASTSKTTAKSCFSQPMPRAAVRNSLVTAVVGSGTSSCRPNSIASNISFCIMLQSNQASSGC